MRGTLGVTPRQNHVQRLVIAVENSVQGVHTAKRSTIYRFVIRPMPDSNLHGSFTIQLTMRVSTDVPTPLHEGRHHTVVRSTQRPVRGEPQAYREHPRW